MEPPSRGISHPTDQGLLTPIPLIRSCPYQGAVATFSLRSRDSLFHEGAVKTRQRTQPHTIFSAGMFSVDVVAGEHPAAPGRWRMDLLHHHSLAISLTLGANPVRSWCLFPVKSALWERMTSKQPLLTCPGIPEHLKDAFPPSLLQ